MNNSDNISVLRELTDAQIAAIRRAIVAKKMLMELEAEGVSCSMGTINGGTFTLQDSVFGTKVPMVKIRPLIFKGDDGYAHAVGVQIINNREEEFQCKMEDFDQMMSFAKKT